MYSKKDPTLEEVCVCTHICVYLHLREALACLGQLQYECVFWEVVYVKWGERERVRECYGM